MSTVTTPTRARRRPLTLSGRAALLAACLLMPPLLGVARAQLLADVVMTTAIAAQFDTGVSLPRGTMRAVGAGVDRLIARIPGASAWTDWEAYALGGVVTALAAAKVHEVTTAYALAGYFETERSVSTVAGPLGQETHTRVVYSSDQGNGRLLYLINGGQEVVWLTARSR